MGMAFVERIFPSCRGEGCMQCDGSGITGSYESVPDMPKPNPTTWTESLRKWRTDARMTLRECSSVCGLRPSELSEIEMGFVQPTPEQRTVIELMMEGKP